MQGGSRHEPFKEPPEGWRGERLDGTLWTRPADRECDSSYAVARGSGVKFVFCHRTLGVFLKTEKKKKGEGDRTERRGRSEDRQGWRG